MARFTRVSGGSGRFFGSAVRDSGTHIRLTISRGCVEHDLGRDWYCGKDELIEVSLSPAQFVELLTTMNVGSGVPCTIGFIQGEGQIDDPPDTGTESEKCRDYFKEKMEQTAAGLRDLHNRVAELAEKLKLKRGEQKEMLAAVDNLVQEVESNMPFYYNQFDNAVGKREAQARANIDAATTLVLQRLGFQKLEEMQDALADAPETLQLKKGKK